MKSGKLSIILLVFLGSFLLLSSIFGADISKLKQLKETDLKVIEVEKLTTRQFFFKDTFFFRSNVIYSENFNSGSNLTQLGFTGTAPTYWTLNTIYKNMESTCPLTTGASNIYTPQFKASRTNRNITVSWTVLPAGRFSAPVKTLPIRVLPLKTLAIKPKRTLVPLRTPEPVLPDWIKLATSGEVSLVDTKNIPVYSLVYEPNLKGTVGTKVSLFKNNRAQLLGSAVIPIRAMNAYQLNFKIDLNCHASGGDVIVSYNKGGILSKYIQCIKVKDETYQSFSKLKFGYQRGKAGQIAIDNIWVMSSAASTPDPTASPTPPPQPTPTPVVDQLPPVTQIDLDPEPNGAGWVNSNVQIYFTSADDVSDVKETQYKIDGGTVQIYDPLNPSVITTNGPHTVEYRSVDNVGREEPWRSRKFTIDQLAPDTTVSPDPGSNWHKGDFTLNFNATDNADGSGVAETWYKYNVDGGAFGLEQTGNTVSFSTSGNYTVEYWSVDNLVNEELPHKKATVKIDADAPEIKNIKPLQNYHYSGTLPPEFKAKFSDTLSGIDTASIKLYLKEGTVSGTDDFGSELSGIMTLSSTNGNDIEMTFTPDHDLAAGDYTVTFKVLDRVGNEKYERRTFFIDP